MTKVDVTVIKKPFKSLPVGATMSVSASDARILVALKRVAMSTAAAPTYQTRMMTAEAPVQVVAPVFEPSPAPAEPDVFVTPPAEREKRQYIRRRPLDAPPDDAPTDDAQSQ